MIWNIKRPWRTIQASPIKSLLVFTVFIFLLSHMGAFTHLREKDYYKDFSYPLDIDIVPLVEQLKQGILPTSPQPINVYNNTLLKTAEKQQCQSNNPKLVFIIKSQFSHLDRRNIIRRTWASPGQFPEVEIHRVFLLGKDPLSDPVAHSAVDIEHSLYHDIIQADYLDTYGNITHKTMSGIKWAVEHCGNAPFFMFVDDDFYISTKNVLRFINRVAQSTQNVQLFAGYVFHSQPHRHKSSKWYVSLEEYPFDLWPPYVTAGAYIVSQSVLQDLYYGSFYTQHFRFDDIFLGLVARRVNVKPTHSPEFYFWKKEYSESAYANTIASHGFHDPEELLDTWRKLKKAGHA